LKPVYLAYALLLIVVILLLIAALAPAGARTIYTTDWTIPIWQG
jgi:hypothetical protein